MLIRSGLEACAGHDGRRLKHNEDIMLQRPSSGEHHPKPMQMQCVLWTMDGSKLSRLFVSARTEGRGVLVWVGRGEVK